MLINNQPKENVPLKSFSGKISYTVHVVVFAYISHRNCMLKFHLLFNSITTVLFCLSCFYNGTACYEKEVEWTKWIKVCFMHIWQKSDFVSKRYCYPFILVNIARIYRTYGLRYMYTSVFYMLHIILCFLLSSSRTAGTQIATLLILSSVTTTDIF